MSSDGTTAIVGGPVDNSNVWVASGSAQQGVSVALSGDGKTALVGGYVDDNSAWAAWVYFRR